MKGSSLLKIAGLLGVLIVPGGSIAAALAYKFKEPIIYKYNEIVRTYIKNKGKKCGQCKGDAVDGHFDSYFCPRCNIWTSGHCKDEKCAICTMRPPKPYSTSVFGKVVVLKDADTVDFSKGGWGVLVGLNEEMTTFDSSNNKPKLGDKITLNLHEKYTPEMDNEILALISPDGNNMVWLEIEKWTQY